MVYSLRKVKIPKTKRTKYELLYLDNIVGFSMPKRKSFSVLDISIDNINLYNKYLSHHFVIKKVNKVYNKLLLLLTELLVTDDESGDTYREALNQIERFRLQIKNKYRMFLKKKELEEMSKQLKLLQMEAKNKMISVNMSYQNLNTVGKSR